MSHLKNEEIGRLFAVATRLTGDPYIGFEVGTMLQPSNLYALGYSLMAITEIAYLPGFTDSANFTRAFRRWTGKSPSEFRN